MCGIVGFVGKGNKTDIIRMNNALKHRGPDETGFWNHPQKSVWLGHSRLSILDIQYGQQPMTNKKGSLTIVFNGQIYNHLEIKKDLITKGYNFTTSHSDTETILHAYAEWGADCVNRFNGMWAFVIIDLQKNRLFASRDRLGQKPFFWSNSSEGFVFASELKAICSHPSIGRTIDPLALQKFFAYGYVPAPLCLYQNIFKLEAGSNLIYDFPTKSTTIHRYWEFTLEPDSALNRYTEKDLGEAIIEKLTNAIKIRLASDVEIGFFLSGGLDSSLIAAITKQVTDKPFKTFSIGFSDKSFDESRYFNAAADSLDSDHYTKTLNNQTIFELAEDIIRKLDEPIGDPSILPTYFLSQHASEHVKVTLSGDGADELFAGYDPFKAIRLAKNYTSVSPSRLRNFFYSLAMKLPVSHNNMSLDFKLKRAMRGVTYKPELWVAMWMSALDKNEMESLFNTPFKLEDVFSETLILWEKCKTKDPYEHALLYFTNLYLQNDILTKIDRASMLNSLEVRSPFLDIELVDYVRKMPFNLKYNKGETKYILKKAAESLLPNDIIYRKKKGFGIPVGKWMQQNTFQFTANIKHCNTSYIQNLISDHQATKENYKDILWNIYCFTKWSGLKSEY